MKDHYSKQHSKIECTRCNEVFQRHFDLIRHSISCAGIDNKTGKFYSVCRVCPDILCARDDKNKDQKLSSRQAGHESNHEMKYGGTSVDSNSPDE